MTSISEFELAYDTEIVDPLKLFIKKFFVRRVVS